MNEATDAVDSLMEDLWRTPSAQNKIDMIREVAKEFHESNPDFGSYGDCVNYLGSEAGYGYLVKDLGDFDTYADFINHVIGNRETKQEAEDKSVEKKYKEMLKPKQQQKGVE